MLCISGAALGVCTSTDDMGKVKREQSDVRRKVKETSGQLDDNRRRAAQSLRELNAIDADIDRKSLEISRIENNVAACDAKIALITDSMKASEARLAKLRSNYAAAVRKMQRNLSSADRLSFILSSSSLHEAWRRMRYLKQFSKWRDRQAEQIHEEIIAMDRRKHDVEKLRGEQVVRNRALQNARTGLEQQRCRQSEAVAKLKSEEKHLKGVLEEQNRRAEALDRELDRLIRLEEARVAEEQRKEHERKLAEERRRALNSTCTLKSIERVNGNVLINLFTDRENMRFNFRSGCAVVCHLCRFNGEHSFTHTCVERVDANDRASFILFHQFLCGDKAGIDRTRLL